MIVKKIDSIGTLGIEKINGLMDDLSREKLGHFYFRPGIDADYKPDVSFSMAHDNKNIALKFFVKENYILALRAGDNDSVCRDSCVEFFVVPGAKSKKYYNFEFNCIGTCLLGHGENGYNRVCAEKERIKLIKRLSSLGDTPFTERQGDFNWGLTAVIPIAVFREEAVSSLSGSQFYANFYKCGDELTKPHWISWAKEEVAAPDFHRPEFFEKIAFE